MLCINYHVCIGSLASIPPSPPPEEKYMHLGILTYLGIILDCIVMIHNNVHVSVLLCPIQSLANLRVFVLCLTMDAQDILADLFKMIFSIIK